jgi:hypothetical protein
MDTNRRAFRFAVVGSVIFSAGFATAHAAAVTGNTYNPATSVILDARYQSFSSDEEYHVPGFPLGGEAGIGEQGFALSEAELAMSANVDDWFYGNLTAAMHQHDGATEVEIEEAFIETTSLGGGFTLKAGKFFSGFGYLNEQHPHSWDFADTALAYRALLGNQIGDDGVQLRWVAPTELFLEFGAEALRGASYPASGNEGDGAGARTVFVRIGGDVGASNSWRVGLSRYSATAHGRSTAGHAHDGEEAAGATFDGDVQVAGLDFVWKWAPDGNPAQRNLKVQFEILRRVEDGEVTADVGDPAVTTTADYDGTQRGWYLQAAYQFIPQWRVAARYDRLVADNDVSNDDVLEAAGLHDEDHEPSRITLAVDYGHSEYSRVRLQFNRDKSSPEEDNNQVIVQYVMSLGAHGAHKF